MFEAVALDYQPVTVIVDATAAATTEIHSGIYEFSVILDLCWIFVCSLFVILFQKR